MPISLMCPKINERQNPQFSSNLVLNYNTVNTVILKGEGK